MKRCPSCRSKSRLRVRRQFLLKFFPKSRSYICYNCGAKYIWIAMFNRSFVIKKGHYRVKESVDTKLWYLNAENKVV